MHCCRLNYKTADKVAKMFQTLDTTAVNCIVYINSAVILIRYGRKTLTGNI